MGLATVLYGGLVLSQGARTFDGQVPIRPPVIPPGMWLLERPPPVTSIRYFAPEGTDQPTTDTFRASIDLSGITQGGTYEVPVEVTSVNSEIQILEVTPAIVTVQLDPLITKIVPVEIERGEVPEGLQVGTETATPSTVTVSGPKTIVDQVVAARADVVDPALGDRRRRGRCPDPRGRGGRRAQPGRRVTDDRAHLDPCVFPTRDPDAARVSRW